MHRFIFPAFIAAALLALSGLRAADRDLIENSDFTRTVGIVFSGTAATVTNSAGVTVTYGSSTSRLAISSTHRRVEYVLSGTSTDGYVEITSTHPAKITLNGVPLTRMA